jgi:hypothetical protein
VKQIPVGFGRFAIVDDEDYEALASFTWRVKFGVGRSPRIYARRDVVEADGKHVTIYMHREIIGAKAGEIVDHADRDGLNNLRANLRLATRLEQSRNRDKWHISGSNAPQSPYKGVCWHQYRSGGRWAAAIRLEGGRRVSLGRFDTDREAAAAYNRAASEHFGAFAVLNEV